MQLCRPYQGITDRLAVNIGEELLGIVPGKVSTECDAHLSYDTQATIDKVSCRQPGIPVTVCLAGKSGGRAAVADNSPLVLQWLCIFSTAQSDALETAGGSAAGDCQLSSLPRKCSLVQGLRLVDLYSKKGIDLSRIYIKVTSNPASVPAHWLNTLPATQHVGQTQTHR